MGIGLGRQSSTMEPQRQRRGGNGVVKNLSGQPRCGVVATAAPRWRRRGRTREMERRARSIRPAQFSCRLRLQIRAPAGFACQIDKTSHGGLVGSRVSMHRYDWLHRFVTPGGVGGGARASPAPLSSEGKPNFKFHGPRYMLSCSDSYLLIPTYVQLYTNSYHKSAVCQTYV